MGQDNFQDREVGRLVTQLKSGCHLRVYRHGESPAFTFSPASPHAASTVRHELAQRLVDEGIFEVVETNTVYEVYVLPQRKAA